MYFHFNVSIFFCTLAMKSHGQSFILIASAVNSFMNKLCCEYTETALYISTLICVFTLTTQETDSVIWNTVNIFMKGDKAQWLQDANTKAE